MRRLLQITIPVALVASSILIAAPPASAATVNVSPGQSIQAAINSAPPGSTINVAAGLYRESIVIRKDGIKLRGAGDSTSGTVLAPPASANSFCSEGPDSFPGICVVAKKFDADFNIITPVNGVQISGFRVRNFPGDGIVSFGGDNLRFVNNTARGNQGYGITSFVSNGSVYNDLVAENNGAPGFYIGDTANAQFTLTNSRATGNQIGIFIREAANGTIANNQFNDNCVGMFFLNHGNSPDQNVDVQNWSVHDNHVFQNNQVCNFGEPFGGVGILLGGTKDVTVENNTIKGNHRVPGSNVGGGVVLSSTLESDGGNVPRDNTIRNNVVLNNLPFDIRYDQSGSGNTFPNNNCETSSPAFICA